MTRNDHSAHSRLVASWRVQPAMPRFSSVDDDWKEDVTHYLKSPHDGHVIRVAFSTYEGHPEYIRVRATNWRAEDEPNGIYHAKDAREFYSRLLQAGFVKAER